MAKKEPEIKLLRTREEMIDCSREYAQAEIERDRLQAKLDAELNSVREKFEKRIALEEAAMAEHGGALVAYCDAEWLKPEHGEFGDGKTIQTPYAELQLRDGNPKTALLKGWNWERVLKRVCEFGLDAIFAVRPPMEPDKSAFIAWRGAQIFNPKTRKEDLTITDLGVEVVQDANVLHITPKREPVAEVSGTVPEAAKEAA